MRNRPESRYLSDIEDDLPPYTNGDPNGIRTRLDACLGLRENRVKLRGISI